MADRSDRPLTPATRDDLIQAVQHGMLFDGRKRTHHWDNINAKVAAEKLVDYLAKANFVVMRGPPAPAHSAPPSGTPGAHTRTGRTEMPAAVHKPAQHQAPVTSRWRTQRGSSPQTLPVIQGGRNKVV